MQTACGWVKHKFGIELDLEEIRKLEPDGVEADWCVAGPRRPTTRRKSEYPVMAGLYRLHRSDRSRPQADRPRRARGLGGQRFQADISLEDLKNKQRDEIRAVLVEHSRE